MASASTIRRSSPFLNATGGLVCPSGHAMDEGLVNCPCCGAYRPSIHVYQDRQRTLRSLPASQRALMEMLSRGPVSLSAAMPVGVSMGAFAALRDKGLVYTVEGRGGTMMVSVYDDTLRNSQRPFEDPWD